MLAIEVGNLDGLIIIFLLIMFGPAVLLAIVGTILSFNNKKKASKVLFIIAVVYVLISLGVCASLIYSS
jgi:hypothetical protein